MYRKWVSDVNHVGEGILGKDKNNPNSIVALTIYLMKKADEQNKECNRILISWCRQNQCD